MCAYFMKIATVYYNSELTFIYPQSAYHKNGMVLSSVKIS